jgi:hypothetical protein
MCKAGLRGKDKMDHLIKNARVETKTDCKVRMTVKFGYKAQLYIANSRNNSFIAITMKHFRSSSC